MSRQEVHSACPQNSIWFDLPEDTFRQHLVALEERTNAVPIEPEVFTVEEWSAEVSGPAADNNDDNNDADSTREKEVVHAGPTLPIKVEQQLADDFACLTAVEEGAQSVAAVCIEESKCTGPYDSHTTTTPTRLTLRFAALDMSLDDTVRVALQGISSIMARAACDPLVIDRDEKSSPQHHHQINCGHHVDELFHCVVRLHFRRLLARLRSTRWVKPRHLAKSHKKPLWQDFDNLVHRAEFLYTRREKATRKLVEDHLRELGTVYRTFEDIRPGEEEEDVLALLRHLVQSTYTLCSRDEVRDYIQRLEMSVGRKITAQMAAAIKTVRQLQKIGAHHRICLSLVGVAQQNPDLFKSGFSVVYLTPYQSTPTTIGYEQWATTCHVHAEVQLAVYYDLAAQDRAASGRPSDYHRPRCIGISKWLCYLCYQFLRAHAGFFPSKTHGRLYDQWTIPDLGSFGPDLVLAYRNIVCNIDREVVRKTESEPELWRIEPMTSIDLPSYLHGK